jgi:hypothetical protein
MIGQYLPNNNETRYRAISLNFSELNRPKLLFGESKVNSASYCASPTPFEILTPPSPFGYSTLRHEASSSSTRKRLPLLFLQFCTTGANPRFGPHRGGVLGVVELRAVWYVPNSLGLSWFLALCWIPSAGVLGLGVLAGATVVASASGYRSYF